MPNNRVHSPIIPGVRPPPPDRLRPDMQKVWRDTVGRMPAGWFGVENYPVLEQLCRVTCYCFDLGMWLDEVDPLKMTKEDLDRYKFIANQYLRLMGLMTSLSRQLRLTVISQRDVRNSRAMMGTSPDTPGKPWPDDASPVN